MNIKGALSAFFTVLFSLTTLSTYAQAVPHARLSTVVQKRQTIEFTIESSEAFYVGGNVFMLHIGNTVFDQYRQTDVDSKGKLSYLIPVSDYAQLLEGEKMYLSYGHLLAPNSTDQDLQRLCADNPHTVKYLGVFNTKLLKK
jgi:hypothetical protein